MTPDYLMQEPIPGNEEGCDMWLGTSWEVDLSLQTVSNVKKELWDQDKYFGLIWVFKCLNTYTDESEDRLLFANGKYFSDCVSQQSRQSGL